jgi:hypothetical protein
MKIEKADLSVNDNDTIRITMPLQKVDKERRIVSGWATLDNEDKHGDVVTKEASSEAWSEFLGNLRLMHQPIPAGKVMNFREEEFFDPETEKVYNGIYVDAYVSKGAPEVWEMVLDGTLKGFSIGGDKVVAETKISKDSQKPVRYVNKYRMTELSLVDNPANQYSNILSIQKSADGQLTASGSLADVTVENVFYCGKTEKHTDNKPVSIVGTDSEKDCLDCGSAMKNIGWLESDGENRVEKVSSIIKKYEADSTEGGEEMPGKKEDAKVEETVDVTETNDVENTEDVSPKGDDEVVAPEEESEESDTATNVEDANVTVTGTGAKQVEEAEEVVQPEFEDGKTVPGGEAVTKLLDELNQTLVSALEKNAEKTSEALANVTTAFEKKLDELAGKHEELNNRVGELHSKLDGVEKSLANVEASGAIKKSADLGGDAGDSSVQKSNGKGSWRGTFFSMDSVS